MRTSVAGRDTGEPIDTLENERAREEAAFKEEEGERQWRGAADDAAVTLLARGEPMDEFTGGEGVEADEGEGTGVTNGAGGEAEGEGEGERAAPVEAVVTLVAGSEAVVGMDVLVAALARGVVGGAMDAAVDAAVTLLAGSEAVARVRGVVGAEAFSLLELDIDGRERGRGRGREVERERERGRGRR